MEFQFPNAVSEQTVLLKLAGAFLNASFVENEYTVKSLIQDAP